MDNKETNPPNILQYPFDPIKIMKKKRTIKRILLDSGGFIDKKIAILGGSTTSEIKNVLELFLLAAGIKPNFYESEYDKYYEDSVFANERLEEFQPDFIYLHTTTANIRAFPQSIESEMAIEEKLKNEFSRFLTIWESLQNKYTAVIIQNNFELPYEQHLGNIDGTKIHGYSHFILQLNQKIVNYIQTNKRMQLNDINYLSAKLGLKNWYDREFWHSYKFALSYDAIPELAYNIAKIIKASLGKSKKCLVLDLDNTLWGGVIGDDGLKGIQLGKETPLGEAYTEFQKYILKLKNRGVLLAVCSKNDIENAKEGFTHPDSLLKLGDFVAFKANWDAKHLNIIKIAKELNIGLDSMVFIDDNPMERQLVRENLPSVTVPEVNGDKVTSYLEIIDQGGFFEPINLLKDDLERNKAYQSNEKRQISQEKFLDYDDFLRSLAMKAEIAPFKSIYLDRITQLTNKTNQFNLTTKRYTIAEIEKISQNAKYIALYGRLEDKFGDNGLVSVIVAVQKESTLYIDLWLMSCRVLKRGMEQAMFDMLVKNAEKCQIKTLVGYYYRTEKNSMVANLYEELGFTLTEKINKDSVWKYDLISSEYKPKNKIIIVNENGTVSAQSMNAVTNSAIRRLEHDQ